VKKRREKEGYETWPERKERKRKVDPVLVSSSPCVVLGRSQARKTRGGRRDQQEASEPL
jgi:hypothetical protein